MKKTTFYISVLKTKTGVVTYLSLEMLQSMTVFLLVLTIMKGRWMMELGGGGLFACCSVCLFRCTRFLKAICYKTRFADVVIIASGATCQDHWHTHSFLLAIWALEAVTVSAWSSPAAFAFPPRVWVMIKNYDAKIEMSSPKRPSLSAPTSKFWHSCAELVGRPIHLISFFSLEIMFMAISTLSAS